MFSHIMLKRCNSNSGMVAIIVRELYQRKIVIPTLLEVNNTCPQHVFKDLDGTLYLPICLRMENNTKLHMCTQNFLERFPKMRSELILAVRNNR